MEFFLELYKDLPKQGPGSDRITEKALSYIPEIAEIRRILDAGCGSGRQTLVLAENTDADIIALDVLDQQIEAFRNTINSYQLNRRVTIHQKSMDDLSFIEEPFDLIWSEGAIYCVGFEKGLRHFHRYLNENGYVAVTEVSWFTDSPDQEIKHFWRNQYPDIKTVEENVSIIESCGYELIHNFHVPSITWWTDYYEILTERINHYKGRTDLNDSAIQTLKETELEIDMFHKYSDQYGYEFFIMKKGRSQGLLRGSGQSQGANR